MRLKNLILISLALPTIAFGQKKNEWSVCIKNGILFNKADLEQRVGTQQYAIVKNTLQQAVGVGYTRHTDLGILFSAGFDIGYERYSADLNFPFEELGYYRSASSTDKYLLTATIPYIQANLNLGYRFKLAHNWSTEIRIGHILHSPLRWKWLGGNYTENTMSGGLRYNLSTSGHYGNAGPDFVAEMLNFIYIGTNLPSKSKYLSPLRVGLQFQKQLIFSKNPLNRFEAEYTAANTQTVSVERFEGTHSTISIVISYIF